MCSNSSSLTSAVPQPNQQPNQLCAPAQPALCPSLTALQPNQTVLHQLCATANELCISQHTHDRDRPGAGKGSGARIQGTTPSGGGAVNSGPAGRLLAPDSSPKSPTPWRPETLPFRHLTHTPPLGLSSARAHPTRRDVDHSSGIVLSVAALDAHRGARRGQMTRGEKAENQARWEMCAT